jgi:PAS domain S-box-containing protein
MQDQSKTKQVLIQELASLRQRIEALQLSESEWKKEKEELKKSEARFRSYFELPLHGIAITSPEKGWIQVNDRICSIMGYSPDEIVRMTWSEMTHPDDLAADLEQYNRVLSGQINQYNLEKRFIRKDGKVVWTSLSVGCVRKPDGGVDHMVAMVDDITSSKQAEKALRESEELYARLIAALPDIMVRMDLNGRILFINDFGLRMSGYTSADLIGQNMFSIIAPEDREKAVRNTILMLEKRLGPKEYHLIMKDGRRLLFEVNGDVLRNEDGSPYGMVQMCRDITDRRQTENALIKSEEKFRKAFYTSPDSVNINRFEDGMYISINPGFTRIMGYTEEDIVGKTSVECDIWLNIEDRQRLLTGLKKDVVVHNLEATFRTKGGDIRYGLMSASVIDLDGVPHILSITRDITDRKQAEEALKESEGKFRLLAENVNDVIFVLDMNLNYTYVSPSVKSLRGYEPAEVLKQPSFETLTPASWDLVMKTFSEIMELEKSGNREIPTSQTLQLEMRRKDGTTVWTEVMFSFIRDKNQRPLAIMGVTRDITERKRTEEVLKESEKKYRELYDFLPIPVYEMDFEATVTSANRAVYETFRASEEDFKKDARAWQLLSPEDIDKSRKNIERLLKGEPAAGTEYYLKRMDGSAFPAIAISSLIYSNNKPVGIRGAIIDITERRRHEAELQQTLESLRKAFGATIQVMVSAVEARDPYTAGHQIRSADLARAIAVEMGLPQEKIDGIQMAGSVHDIGKLSIPSELLTKPTKLTELEFSLIKEHSRSGYEILKDVESPWPIAQIVYQHHERMNGSGYPRNLKGDEILIEARIMAVADVVESMASDRPYRPALGIDAALEEIEQNKGIFYDIDVADACLMLFRGKGYQLK